MLFTFSQSSVAIVISTDLNSNTTSQNFLSPSSTANISSNQCIDEKLFLNNTNNSTLTNSCPYSVINETGCNNVEPKKIFITLEGMVQSSAVNILEKGQNIFDSWTDTDIYNMYGFFFMNRALSYSIKIVK